MARPEGTPLINYLHTELDDVIGAANVQLVLDTLVDWFQANRRLKTAQVIQITDPNSTKIKI